MGKHKKEQPEKWYSMVDLVFLLIIFWPAAIIYMMVKSKNRDLK